MYYRSKFVVGLQGSESIFICQTLQRELLTLSVVPRNHVVMIVGDWVLRRNGLRWRKSCASEDVSTSCRCRLQKAVREILSLSVGNHARQARENALN